MPRPRPTAPELPLLPAPHDAVSCAGVASDDAIAMLNLFQNETAAAEWDAERRTAVAGDVRYCVTSIAMESPQIAMTRRQGGDEVSGMVLIPFDLAHVGHHWTRDPLGLARWTASSARAVATAVGDGDSGRLARAAVERTARLLSDVLSEHVAMRYLEIAAGAGPWACDLRTAGFAGSAAGDQSLLADATDDLTRMLADHVPPTLLYEEIRRPGEALRVSISRLVVPVEFHPKTPTIHARAIRTAPPSLLAFAQAFERRFRR